MQYKIRVIENNEKTDKPICEVHFHHIDFPNIKSIVEYLEVSIEENIHPIILILTEEGSLNIYRFYFTRRLAKVWLHKLLPCDKAGIEITIRGVEWDGI